MNNIIPVVPRNKPRDLLFHLYVYIIYIFKKKTLYFHHDNNIFDINIFLNIFRNKIIILISSILYFIIKLSE